MKLQARLTPKHHLTKCIHQEGVQNEIRLLLKGIGDCSHTKENCSACCDFPHSLFNAEVNPSFTGVSEVKQSFTKYSIFNKHDEVPYTTYQLLLQWDLLLNI